MSGHLNYVHADSFVHRLDPRIKLLWFVTTTVVMTSWQDPIWQFGLFSSVLAFGAAAGILPKEILKAVGKGLPLLLIVFVLNLFLYDPPGKPLFLGHVIPVIGGKGPYVALYLETLVFSVATIIRLSVILSATMVLMRITAPTELALGIVKLGLPPEVGMAVSISIGYVPVLIGQITEVLEAQQSRGWKVGTGNPIQRIKAYIPIFIPTFFRSYVASEEMAAAMSARGFGYNMRNRTEMRPLLFRTPDKVLGVACIVFLVVGFTLGILGFAHYGLSVGIVRKLFYLG